MKNSEKIKAIQDISSKNNKFDLPYYIYYNIEKKGITKTSSPMKIGFKITNACSFNCLYCFTYKNHDYMCLETIKKTINELNQKPYEVYLTGGDPLLHPDLFKIIDFLYSNNIRIKLQTTGICSENTLKLINENINKIFSIQLSIDSIKDFEKIRISNIDHPLDKIKYFISGISNKEKLTINTVISNYNYNQLNDIVDFCIENNISQLRFSPIFCEDRSMYKLDDELLDRFYKIAIYMDENNIKLIDTPFSHPWSLRLLEDIESSRLFCPAQKTEIEIDVNGDVYPCPFLHDSVHRMGNVISENINEVWIKGVPILNKPLWSENKICKNCNNYSQCGGGCYANAFVNKTNYDVRCLIHEKIKNKS